MEELKLILQTLATMGESAKTAFIWWLVVHELIPTLLFTAFGFSVVWGIVTSIRRGCQRNTAVLAIRQIRQHLGLMKYPSLNEDTSVLEDKEYAETIAAVAKRIPAKEK